MGVVCGHLWFWVAGVCVGLDDFLGILVLCGRVCDWIWLWLVDLWGGCISGFSFVVAFVGVTGSGFLVFWVWV